MLRRWIARLATVAVVSVLCSSQAGATGFGHLHQYVNKHYRRHPPPKVKYYQRHHHYEPQKVRLCHCGGPNCHSIEISTSALSAHLRHGDTLGACHASPHY